MKRKYSSGFGSRCECICHKRTSASDYCGYCSRSHTTSYGYTKNKYRLARPIGILVDKRTRKEG